MINLAYAFGPAIGGWLADLYGARTSFVIVGSAAAAASLGFSLLPETHHAGHPKHADRAEQVEPAAQRTTWAASDAADAAEAGGAVGEARATEGPREKEGRPAQAGVLAVYGPLLRNPDQQGPVQSAGPWPPRWHARPRRAPGG